MVVSGSNGGTIKVWDLNSERMQKSFNYGHKTNVTCLDYHPFGNFFCSGSADTQVKVWDLRKKSYLQTYKGHTKQVNTLKFSPDGRWVVSGGADGVVKLWDLTAGKQMEDFTRHTGEITCLDFHPSEFLLAVGSADRTITFWDLDKFKQVSQTPLDTKPVRSIRFTPDGTILCGSTSESLKVWAWEPVVCYDSVDVQWQNVGDMHVTEAGELFGISYVDSFASIWNVRLQQMQPFAAKSGAPREPDPSPVRRPAPVLPPPALLPPPSKTPPSFQSPTSAKKVDRVEHREYTVSADTKAARITELFQNAEDIQKRFGLVDTYRGGDPIMEQKRSVRKSLDMQPGDMRSGYQGHGVYPEVSAPVTPSSREAVSFAPEKFVAAPRTVVSDSALMEKILNGHHTLCQVLTQRLTNVKVLRSLWAHDKRGAIQHVQQLNDPSMSVEFVKQAIRKERDLSLDLCVGVLPVVRHIFSSSFESHLVIALEATSTIWYAFGDTILTTLTARSHVVDVNLEDRKNKCRIAKSLLAEIRLEVHLLKDRKDDVGQRSRLLWKELPSDTYD